MHLVDCDSDGAEAGNFVREEMLEAKLGHLGRRKGPKEGPRVYIGVQTLKQFKHLKMCHADK